MTHKKDDFDPNAPNIIAHSRVEVLSSSTWAKSNIPVFATGIRINLSVMNSLSQEGSQPWLRIHRSPDPFAIVKRSPKHVRLQHDSIWVEISTYELEALLAKAEAVREGCTREIEQGLREMKEEEGK